MIGQFTALFGVMSAGIFSPTRLGLSVAAAAGTFEAFEEIFGP